MAHKAKDPGSKANKSNGKPPENERTDRQASAATEPAPGLDDDKHAAAQRTAHQAEILRAGIFPALMASALRVDSFVDAPAYRVFLEQVLADAGDPDDPIERMLIEQICMAHFRIAQLHVGAGQAQGLEATKLYNSVAARMLGEFRRTALALRAYRLPNSEGRSETRVKLLKMAK